MPSADSQPAPAQLDFVGALLVADTRAFVEAWREILGADPAGVTDQVAELGERSKTLQIRARAAGIGGLAHHLAAAEKCLQGGSWDRDQLEETLRNVLELTWQLEQELDLRKEAAPASAPGLPASAPVAVPDPVAVSNVADEPPVEPPPLLSAAWPGWKRRAPPAEGAESAESAEPSSPSAELQRSAESRGKADAAAALSQVLGLAPPGIPRLAAGESRELGGVSPRPPRLGPDPSGLPVLEMESDAEEDLTDQDLEIRLERVRRAAPYPYPLGQGEIAIDLPLQSAARFRRRGIRARLAWWIAPLAVGVLGSLVALVLLLGSWRRAAPAAARGDVQATTTRSEALLPMPRLTEDREELRALLVQVHGHGGVESPELTDLLDEEAALLAKAMAEPCTPGSLACRLSEQAREILAQAPVQKAPRATTALGGWLSELQLPQIGLKDDPRVRKLVEYHTQDAVGREVFQGLLFRCGQHQELFRDNLMQHGLPLDLVALVMVESGCVLDAESPLGARGLWQFMPATARAYHLRVKAGVIDERLSPPKSTDAALEFLGDLYRKLRSWELALASYNMGPFGLLARMRRAGPDVDYWDLVDAGRLPPETAAYVPKIEAFALILANLEHFRFDLAQHKLEPAASVLLVPAGTRLGMVARAAGSSASRIRELNPELIAETVPGASGEQFSLRVPSEAAPRALEFLQRLLAQADDADECVPASFDWGRQQFTRAMLSRCKR